MQVRPGEGRRFLEGGMFCSPQRTPTRGRRSSAHTPTGTPSGRSDGDGNDDDDALSSFDDDDRLMSKDEEEKDENLLSCCQVRAAAWRS